MRIHDHILEGSAGIVHQEVFNVTDFAVGGRYFVSDYFLRAPQMGIAPGMPGDYLAFALGCVAFDGNGGRRRKRNPGWQVAILFVESAFGFLRYRTVGVLVRAAADLFASQHDRQARIVGGFGAKRVRRDQDFAAGQPFAGIYQVIAYVPFPIVEV